ncbi:hypothetical protein QJS66_04445 [Kocuria rhizophila]|nr:hypothetical protein QJS66_04445 [Kocuria rhizophila]
MASPRWMPCRRWSPAAPDTWASSPPEAVAAIKASADGMVRAAPRSRAEHWCLY